VSRRDRGKRPDRVAIASLDFGLPVLESGISTVEDGPVPIRMPPSWPGSAPRWEVVMPTFGRQSHRNQRRRPIDDGRSLGCGCGVHCRTGRVSNAGTRPEIHVREGRACADFAAMVRRTVSALCLSSLPASAAGPGSISCRKSQPQPCRLALPSGRTPPIRKAASPNQTAALKGARPCGPLRA
jgi:hypothetical protein